MCYILLSAHLRNSRITLIPPEPEKTVPSLAKYSRHAYYADVNTGSLSNIFIKKSEVRSEGRPSCSSVLQALIGFTSYRICRTSKLPVLLDGELFCMHYAKSIILFAAFIHLLMLADSAGS